MDYLITTRLPLRRRHSLPLRCAFWSEASTSILTRATPSWRMPSVDLAPRPRDAAARAVEAERKRLGLSWEEILKSW